MYGVWGTSRPQYNVEVAILQKDFTWHSKQITVVSMDSDEVHISNLARKKILNENTEVEIAHIMILNIKAKQCL